MKKTFNFVFFLYIFFQVLCVKYPKNKNIINYPKDSKIRTIEIQSINELKDYIKNSSYVINTFYKNWSNQCKLFLSIFDEGSKYQFLNRIEFLKINCDNKEICDEYNIEKYPTIKVYIKGNEFKREPVRELIPFLEYLDKIINNPIINITNDDEFYKKYGTFSPIIEYNEKNIEFISCILNLANNYFFYHFYFGLKKIEVNINKEVEEKIKFNFDGMNKEFIWDNNCNKTKDFLNDNIYPIINKINNSFLKSVQKDFKITIILFYHNTNLNQINFIHNQFKKIAFDNRKYIFGYADINEEINLAKYFGVSKIKGNMQIVIYDFKKLKSYIHNESFDVDSYPPEKTENEIRKLILNEKNLIYNTGDFFEDIFVRFGFKSSPFQIKLILISCIFIILFIFIIIIIYCGQNEPIIHPKKD